MMPARTLARYFHFLEESLLFLLMAILILVACGQILLRNFFEVTLLWADALIRHLVLWCGFLGALIATRMDKHIRIDALLRLLSRTQQRWLILLTNLFSACICGLLTWISILFLQDELSFGARTFFDWPSWKLQLIFPLTFSIMCLRFAARGLYTLLRDVEALP